MDKPRATPSPSPGRTKDPEATRASLVRCAFEEIYEHGYAGASLDRILSRTGVTRGALYHHFASKAELAQAVIDELIRGWILEEVAPLRTAPDPLQALIDSTRERLQNTPEQYVKCGCPLNNLNQELANTDEEFRTRLDRVYDLWRAGIEEGLTRGRDLGLVRADVDPAAVAAFVVSVIQGAASTLKSSRDRDLGRSIASVLLGFLEGLRSPAPGHPDPAAT